MPIAGSDYDYTIEDKSAGTPIYGFMLGPRGKSRTRLADYPAIAPRVLSQGEFTHAEAPPGVELSWHEEDWRGGVGGYLERLHPGSYATGLKVEPDDEGKMVLARDVISTTLDLNPAVFMPSGFAKVGTEVWAFIGREVYSRDSGGTAWTQGVQPENVLKIYKSGVEFSGNTYTPAWLASDETPQTYIYKADADANWTLSTLAQNNFKYFAVANELLWGGYQGANTNQVRSASSATNTGAWSGATSVGDTSSPITALVGDGPNLFVCKTDGVYTLFADGSVENLTPEFATQAHPDNFRGAFNWNGRILLPLGAGGMVEMSDGKLHDVSMTLYAPRQTTLQGRVVAITGTPTRLFILVFDSANTIYRLLGSRWLDLGDGPDYRWHQLGTVSYTTGTTGNLSALFSDGVPAGTTIRDRIWVGINSTGSNLTPSFIPGDTDAGDVYTNDTDPTWDTVDWDSNLPLVTKQYSEATFETENLGAGANDHFIEVQRRVNRGTFDWFTGAQAASTLTSSPQTLQLPVELSGRDITLRFLPQRGTTTTTTPRLLNFTLKGRLRPSPIKSMPLRAYIMDGMILRNGTRFTDSANVISQLRSWNAGAVEVVLRTADSQAFDAVFVPGEYKEVELFTGRRHRVGYIVDFLLVQV